VSELTGRDDAFHPIADPDPMWTETSWWGFLVPERNLAGMVYALFRPNLGITALVVQVWNDRAVEPWRAPYSRVLWHLPHPKDDLTDCRVGGLHIERLEPLSAYRLTYADDDLLAFELRYDGLAPPHNVAVDGGSGHFDQVCRVTGSLRILDGEEVTVDGPAMRDRSWYVRPDLRSLRAGYTYGVVDETEHFVVHSFAAEPNSDETMVFGGYLVRDGRHANLTGGTRRVVSRREGSPAVVEVDANDAEGRTLRAVGHTFASLASLSTPGMFAWMSGCYWDVDEDRKAIGEDHDVWSPDHLARGAARDPYIST
jgi:hypothetical protein